MLPARAKSSRNWVKTQLTNFWTNHELEHRNSPNKLQTILRMAIKKMVRTNDLFKKVFKEEILIKDETNKNMLENTPKTKQLKTVILTVFDCQ